MKQPFMIYLASGSPRRSEILSQMGLKFQVVPSDAPEDSEEKIPENLVRELSYRKASWVIPQITEENAVIIGADTVVAIDDKILGKPIDFEDAKRMLRLLSGRSHEVYTGVTIGRKFGRNTDYQIFVKCSRVHVMALSEQEISAYVTKGSCLDKAGAYGIQGEFGKYIEGFEGDYYNIVGLPMNELYKKLKENNLIFV